MNLIKLSTAFCSDAHIRLYVYKVKVLSVKVHSLKIANSEKAYFWDGCKLVIPWMVHWFGPSNLAPGPSQWFFLVKFFNSDNDTRIWTLLHLSDRLIAQYLVHHSSHCKKLRVQNSAVEVWRKGIWPRFIVGGTHVANWWIQSENKALINWYKDIALDLPFFLRRKYKHNMNQIRLGKRGLKDEIKRIFLT